MPHQIEVIMYPDGRLDAKNASRYLGISTKTLAMFRYQGKGPQYIKRGKIFYFKDDLDEWLNDGRAMPDSQLKHREG